MFEMFISQSKLLSKFSLQSHIKTKTRKAHIMSLMSYSNSKSIKKHSVKAMYWNNKTQTVLSTILVNVQADKYRQKVEYTAQCTWAQLAYKTQTARLSACYGYVGNLSKPFNTISVR